MLSEIQIPHFGLKRQFNTIKSELLDATHRSLENGVLLNGPYTKKFEDWLKNKTKTLYAVLLHSGTQALEIIARYKISQYKSTTVILPNISYIATLNAFLSAGHNVNLFDTDNYGILTQGIIRIPENSCICLVGLYGRSPWHYYNIGNQKNIIVDGAQHWLVANGAVGLGMAISFDPTKNLPASGNGGAIVTNDENLYLYAKSYCNNAKPHFDLIGTNSKMSEQDCAHLLVRSKYLDEWQERRRLISNYWIEQFKNLPVCCLADTKIPHSYQKFVLTTNNRDDFNSNMNLNGIETKIHYEYTLDTLPVARNFENVDSLTISNNLIKKVISLPLYPELTDDEVVYIAETVKKLQKDK